MKEELKLKDGTPVPGATTITKLLDKSFLIKWANELGKKGIDYTKYVTNTARRGTMIHSILESHNTHTSVDLGAYSDEEIDIGIYIFYENYMKWEKSHIVEPIFCEKDLVSEEFKFGGIIDFYAKVDGKYTVIDYKTSKKISSEHILQVSSYIQLLKENNYPVDQMLILNVKKEKDQPLEERLVTLEESEPYWNIFKHLLAVYWIKKDLHWQ